MTAIFENKKIVLVISVLLLAVIVLGGWYAYKYRECVGDVSYVPAREQTQQVQQVGSGWAAGGLRKASDKGDYYQFRGRDFKTSQDAIRACIWN